MRLVNFVAAESEVFKVVAGPTQAGSYDWWQLVAPYDNSRQGWAAGEFFDVRLTLSAYIFVKFDLSVKMYIILR